MGQKKNWYEKDEFIDFSHMEAPLNTLTVLFIPVPPGALQMIWLELLLSIVTSWFSRCTDRGLKNAVPVIVNKPPLVGTVPMLVIDKGIDPVY